MRMLQVSPVASPLPWLVFWARPRARLAPTSRTRPNSTHVRQAMEKYQDPYVAVRDLYLSTRMRSLQRRKEGRAHGLPEGSHGHSLRQPWQ